MTSDNLLIRPFESSDQFAACKLIQQGLGEHFGFIDERLNPDLNDIMQSYIVPGYIFLVAYSGSDLVGTGALITEAEETGRIVRVSTHSTHRRKGIGQTIVKRLLALARERGYKRVVIETNIAWLDAIGLYEHLGFTEYARDSTCIHMALELFPVQEQINERRL